METMADRIRGRMNMLKIKQGELAKRCNTSQPSINRLLKGETDSPEYIWELSLALVTSVQWLKTGIEDKSLEFMLKYKHLVDAYESSPKEIREIIDLQLRLGGPQKSSLQETVRRPSAKKTSRSHTGV